MEDNEKLPSDKEIQERIVHVLGIYPVLSHSMLQIGLGSNLPSKAWRPVLRTMIEKKVVIREELVLKTPSGQHRPYTRLSLNSTHS